MAENIKRRVPIQWIQTIKDDGTYEFNPDPNVYSTQKNVPLTSKIDFQNILINGTNPTNPLSSSYATSASYAETASFFSGSISNAINAISASYALTASYAMNSKVIDTPFRISTGSISASVNIGSTIFLITNRNIPILTVSQSGVIVLATQPTDPTGIAPNGSIYFTSSSLFIGLDDQPT